MDISWLRIELNPKKVHIAGLINKYLQNKLLFNMVSEKMYLYARKIVYKNEPPKKDKP
jgi:hypothetical protein